MLKEVTATMNIAGDRKDLTEFPGSEVPIEETLEDFRLELSEQLDLTTGETDNGKEGNYGARDRPRVVAGVTDEVMTAGGKLFVTLNADEDWKLFEVFIRVGKCGEIEYAHLEGLARMVSYCLRIGGRVEGIVDQLSGITSEPIWDRGVLVRSAEDGVAIVLRRFLDGGYDSLLERILDSRSPIGSSVPGAEAARMEKSDAARPSVPSGQGEASSVERVGNSAPARGIRCVKCGGRVVFQEGCMMCLECGYGKCD